MIAAIAVLYATHLYGNLLCHKVVQLLGCAGGSAQLVARLLGVFAAHRSAGLAGLHWLGLPGEHTTDTCRSG